LLKWGEETIPAPSLDSFLRVGSELGNRSVGVKFCHVGGRQQELPNVIGIAFPAPTDLSWNLFEPEIGGRLWFQQSRIKGSATRANQGVACMQLIAEPGGEFARMKPVEP